MSTGPHTGAKRLRALLSDPTKIVVCPGVYDGQTLGFGECITRLRAAVEIGADVAFIDAIKTKEECRKACEIMGDTPVMFKMCIGAGSPDLTVQEARELGFRIIIFPGVCSSMVLASCKESLGLLKREGKEEMRGEGGVRELFETCGLKDAVEIDRNAGGQSYSELASGAGDE